MFMGGRLKRLLAYVRRFGIARGTRHFLQTTKRNGIVCIRLRADAPPLFLRAGTSDIDVFDEVFVRRAYMTEALATKHLNVIVDAGANVGVTSVFFAQSFPGARIIAIEPAESNWALLRRNIEGYPQIAGVNAALWGSETDVRIEDPGRGFWSLQVAARGAPRAGEQSVPAVGIDTILRRFALPRIDLLKIDIEGAERDVFSGNVNWLNAIECLVIELHDRFAEGCSRIFYSAITKYRFTQEIKDKNIFVHMHGPLPVHSPDAIVQGAIAH